MRTLTYCFQGDDLAEPAVLNAHFNLLHWRVFNKPSVLSLIVIMNTQVGNPSVPPKLPLNSKGKPLTGSKPPAGVLAGSSRDGKAPVKPIAPKLPSVAGSSGGGKAPVKPIAPKLPSVAPVGSSGGVGSTGGKLSRPRT